MRITSDDIKQIQLFKYYRIVRKWICRANGINDARNRTTIKYTVYKTSFKCEHMISRIYRILLGEEDIPVSIKNPYYKNKSYTDKVMNKSIDDMIKDKDR